VTAREPTFYAYHRKRFHGGNDGMATQGQITTNETRQTFIRGIENKREVWKTRRTSKLVNGKLTAEMWLGNSAVYVFGLRLTDEN